MIITPASAIAAQLLGQLAGAAALPAASGPVAARAIATLGITGGGGLIWVKRLVNGGVVILRQWIVILAGSSLAAAVAALATVLSATSLAILSALAGIALPTTLTILG